MKSHDVGWIVEKLLVGEITLGCRQENHAKRANQREKQPLDVRTMSCGGFHPGFRSAPGYRDHFKLPS
jgi:hypothetical protein